MKTLLLLIFGAALCGLLGGVGHARAQNWVQTSAPATNWSSVACSADGTKLVAAAGGGSTAGGIYLSTNGGATWSQSSAPLAGWSSVAASAVDLARAQNWVQTSAPSALWYSIASSADGGKLAAATYGGLIYTSTNNGTAWAAASGPSNWWTSIASSADGTRIAAIIGSGSGFAVVSISTNSGGTWSLATLTNAYSTTNICALASSADGTKLAATVARYGIYTRQAIPAPALNIVPHGGGIVLSWIVPSISFALQQNSDLRTTNWTDVATAPTPNLTNLQYQVSVAATNLSKFYRLVSK